jgi:putative DNA primase/helicase
MNSREVVASMVAGPWNDSGVADRVLRIFPDRFRYRSGVGWMVWKDTHWQADRSGVVIECIAITVDFMVAASDLIVDQTARDKWSGFCRGLGNTAKLYAVAKRLETWPTIAVVDGWDADAYALSHLGGTLDLRSGATRPHTPADLITHCAPAREVHGKFAFAGDGISGSRWSTFLEEILPDPDLRAYTQRAVGLSIIGRQSDHVVFMATGTGRNGKGSFFRGISNALGDYASAIPSTMLVESGTYTHPTEIADLAGRRLCVSAELPTNRKLDENKVKELTGGDKLKARFMNRDFFEFAPSHTLWICCNQKPRITGTDNGIWRRLKVLPFLTTIAPDKVDRWLDEKLAAESDVILTWCLEGARLYQAQGLGTCEAVDAATTDYRAAEDTLAAALVETCELGENYTTTSADLHKALTKWWGDMGLLNAPNQIVLGRELAKRGFDRYTNGMDRGWRGLTVKAEWRQEQQGSWGRSSRNWQD